MKHSWSVLFISSLAVLHLTSSVSYCDDCWVITVNDTIYKTPLGKDLEIKCYIIGTGQLPNPVSWYKLESNKFVPVTNDSHIEIKLEKLSDVKMMLLLRFTNIQQSNAGSYRCESGSDVGHSINVSVYDNDTMTNISLRNDTTGHVTRTETEQSRGEPQSVPIPSGSYIYSEMSAEEGKHSKTSRVKDDRSAVTYATLDHQLLAAAAAGTPARPRRLQEERSHYADIRL
nr:uncharacterized protein LOC125987957 isoform X3 [Syngnathus scovelli]